MSTSNSIFDTVAILEQEDHDDDDEIQLHGRRRRIRETDDTEKDDDDDNNNDDRMRRQRQKMAVQAQTNIYSRLMECRILLQRSMTSLVETPNSEQQQQQQQQILEDDRKEKMTMGANANAAIDQCNQILIHLLEARKLLNANNDNDSSHSNVVDYASLLHNSATSFPLEEQLQQEYTTCQQQWKEVLNRRHYDLQLHAGMMNNNHKKFNMIDTSFWHQVQSTIQHQQLRHDRNVNRDDEIISTLSLQQHQQPSFNYQPFNDTKIYQQMLKDFVETTNSSHHNGTTKSQAAALLRKRHPQHRTSLSSSQKAMVDRKASKGRKIRYTTITKLTNFTFPIQRRHTTQGLLGTTAATIDNSSTTAMNTFLDEDAWFRSLFGGK